MSRDMISLDSCGLICRTPSMETDVFFSIFQERPLLRAEPRKDGIEVASLQVAKTP